MLSKKTMDELAWYANGSLPETDRTRIEAELAVNKEMRQQLVFYRQLQAGLRQSVPGIAADHGLSEVMRRIHGESKKTVTSARNERRNTVHKPWWRRLLALDDRGGGRIVLGACAAIMLAQFGVIGAFMQGMIAPPEYSDVRKTVSAVVSEGPFIKISFKPSVKQDDVRFLLIEEGASIIGGPTQVGDYYIYVEPKRLDASLTELKQSPLVDRAARIEQLPAVQD